MRASFLPFALFALSALGCAPDIGDSCETSIDCSQTGERLCDVSQSAHGGYCTVFDCEPNDCPDEADCVLFGASPSSSSECLNTSGNNPSQRSFCMKQCDNNADCRTKDGYICMIPLDPAINLEGNGQRKVCMLPQSGDTVPKDRPGEVCMGENPPSGGAGTGGMGGTAGSGGSGGSGGMSGGGEAGDGGQGGESGAGG